MKLKNQESSKKIQKSEFSKKSKNIQKTIYFFRKYGGPPVFSIVFWIFFDFLGNLLVTLKTVKNCNLQANFQKMEKSDLCLSKLFQNYWELPLLPLKRGCWSFFEDADLNIKKQFLNLRHDPQPLPQPQLPDPGSWICILWSCSRGRSPLQRHRSMQIQDPGSGGCGCGFLGREEKLFEKHFGWRIRIFDKKFLFCD